MSFVWLDGRRVAKEEARISLFDHAVLFGDAISEGVRVYNNRLFLFAEHLQRLHKVAKQWCFTIPYDNDQLRTEALALLQANERTDGYLKIVITRGAGTLGLDHRKCEPMIAIIAEDVVPYPRELALSGLDVILAPLNIPTGLEQQHLTTFRVQAKQAALAAGCLEALLHNSSQHILSGSETQLILRYDHELWCTPGSDVFLHWALGKLTRQGYTINLDPITIEMLRTGHEVVLCSPEYEFILIRRVNDQALSAEREIISILNAELDLIKSHPR